jgi:hypothetical protein
LVESEVPAVIDGITNKYSVNKDETKIFVPTKEYSEFGVHQRQAVFCCCAEITAGSQPAARVVSVVGDNVPPPPVIPNPNPIITIEAGMFTFMVTELTAAHQERRQMSDPSW